MEILNQCHQKCAMALGNFDGLHLAHMEIINSCKMWAKKQGIKSGVLLFDRHTSEFFGHKVKLLTTTKEKLEILEKSGIDFVCIMPFTKELAQTDGEKFLQDILADFSVNAFFVGYDYTYGKGAMGNADSLREYGKTKDFQVFVTNCMKKNNEEISSTAIRERVARGDMPGAKELLGRNYFICQEVVTGFGNGKKALFPTANLEIPEDKFLPCDGVYAGISLIGGKRYRAAVNVGKNPTFDAKKRTVESYILDFSGELYGEDIRVEFLEMIRPEKKFESVSKLKEQITQDIEKIKNIDIEE